MCIFRCKKAAETTTEENHGWIWWWVLATCIIILITIVCQLHSGKYYFDKDKYPIVGEWIDDSVIRTPSTDWEDMCLEAERWKESCVIAECTVIGGSYNMVKTDRPSGIVLTPIRIDKIHKFYAGETSISLQEGQTAYVIENYSYVNSHTPFAYESCHEREGIIRRSGYNPLVTGKYIMFLWSDSNYYQLTSDNDYCQYNTTPVSEDNLFFRFFPTAFQIADTKEVEGNRIEVSSDFWELWTDVMKTYAGYTADPPAATTP